MKLRETVFVSLWLVSFIMMMRYVNGQTAQDHLVTQLPGLSGNIGVKSYTGYLLANATRGRYLFYWFFESMRNPSQDPLVMWVSNNIRCENCEK